MERRRMGRRKARGEREGEATDAHRLIRARGNHGQEAEAFAAGKLVSQADPAPPRN